MLLKNVEKLISYFNLVIIIFFILYIFKFSLKSNKIIRGITYSTPYPYFDCV